MEVFTALLAALAGATGWSLTEYWLHRAYGHDPKKNTAFTREHIQHHRDPDYFAPATFKARATAKVSLFLVPIVVWGLGPLVGISFVVGFLGFYSTYEVIHRRIHTHPPTGPYSRFVRKHHLFHHFEKPQVNHGVTTPIWDLVFGTFEHVEVVRVPRKLVTRWLCNPTTTEIWPEFAGDYSLRGKAIAQTDFSASGAAAPLQNADNDAPTAPRSDMATGNKV